VFFARLNELRGGPKPGPRPGAPAPAPAQVEAVEASHADTEAPEGPPAVDESSAPETEAPAVEEALEPPPATDEQPAEATVPAEELVAELAEPAEPAAPGPAAEAAPAADDDTAQTGPPDLSTGRDQARLAAAIERVGGPDAIREALQPKRDEAGKPLKWAAVCCEASQGFKPGDPVFAAWVRLAATPVREIKSRVPDDRPDRGRGRGGPRGGGGAGGSGGGGGFGGGGGGFRGGRDNRGGGRGGQRDDTGRASREDMQKHAFGGRVGAKIVIPGFEPAADAEPEPKPDTDA